MRISDWSSDVCSSDLCGVVGMRPTPGVVPTVRKEMAWSPMWTEGPMARSVADLALFLEALAGGDARGPLSGFTRGADFAGLKPAALEGLRFAYSEEHTSDLQSLMRTSYDVFGLKKK